MLLFNWVGQITVALFAVSLGSISNSVASGFSASNPFSIRFDAALSRYGNYGDVLGVGGASTGSTFSSSSNPASTVVRNQKNNVLTISPQFTNITFDNDHELNLSIIGGTLRVNDTQKIEYGIAAVDSSSARRRGDLAGSAFTLEASLYAVGWSGAIGDRNQCGESSHFVGVSYSNQRTDTLLLFGVNAVVSDVGDSNSISLGYLHHTRVGDAGSSETVCNENSNRNNLALGITLSLGESDTIRTSMISSSGNSESSNQSLRLGAGYRIGQGRYLYSDLQYGQYENTSVSNVTDSIDVTRLFTDIQW